jgi:hypothetical protein
MSTEKQIAANRLNALKSTGPTTPEGRAAVRLNGVKHGLTAQTLVLKGESEADFQSLLDSLETEHQPTTPTEELLVAQMVMAAWRLRRLYHQEAGFHAFKMKDLADIAKRNDLDDSEHMGLAADRSNQTLAMFHRQEVRLERSFYKAVQELHRLRALHAKSEKINEKAAEKAADNPRNGFGLKPLPVDSQPEPSQPPQPAQTGINDADDITNRDIT